MNRISTIFILFISALFATAETSVATETSVEEHNLPIDYTVPVYDTMYDASLNFIDADTNVITGDLAPFYEKLAELKRGERSRVSIVQIGDSHIQAGYMSRAFREAIQKAFGNAGRGLILPHKIVGTNEAPDYRLYSPNRWSVDKITDADDGIPMGVGGFGISNNAKAVRFDISVVEEASPLDYRFNTVKVFHHPNAPVVIADSSLLTDVSCPDTTLNYISQINLRERTQSLNLYAVSTEKYDKSVFYGFSLENGDPGVIYHAIGTNGACHRNYIKYPETVSQIEALEPDLVIISLGANESAGRNFIDDVYRDEMANLVSLVKQSAPGASIMITSPAGFFSRGRNNANCERISRIEKEFSEKNGLSHWNLYAISGSKSSSSGWQKAGMMQRDRIHFTQEGYRVQGELLYNAIAKGYMNYTRKYTTH